MAYCRKCIKVILFSVCIDSYVKSCFAVLVCKFEAVRIKFFTHINKTLINIRAKVSLIYLDQLI